MANFGCNDYDFNTMTTLGVYFWPYFLQVLQIEVISGSRFVSPNWTLKKQGK